ncbi:helix-turn-helix transcriptional regulator, partial [Mycobacteroides abscessus subsp. massiliense]|uniref:helix-turn-helix domain-containing protein n=1 Tax=Mycobacteroides abscessus TaxID=36809 RepID=UPI003CF7FAA1
MNFAEKLQMLRTERHMSQETLAEAVGVSRQAISKWESGLANPEMEKIIRLSDLFQVSIDYLVKENETREKEVSPGFESGTERA